MLLKMLQTVLECANADLNASNHLRPPPRAEAFKILRQRHAERKKNHRKRASTEPGEDSAFGDSPEPKVGKLTLKVKASGPDTGGKAAQTGGSAARRLPQLPLPSGQAPKLLHNLAAPQ